MPRTAFPLTLRLAAFASAIFIPLLACRTDSQGAAATTAAVSAGGTSIIGIAGKCIDDRGGATDNGTSIQLWDCNGTAAQAWTYTAQGQLQGPAGKCIDVTDGDASSGTLLQLYDCNGTPSQQWSWTGAGAIVGLGGMCIDDQWGSTNDGNPLQIYPCNGSAAQQWSRGAGASEHDASISATGATDAAVGPSLQDAGPDAPPVRSSACRPGADCPPLRADVFLIETLSVCLSGNPCPTDADASATTACIEVLDDSGNVTAAFANDSSFRAAAPGSSPNGPQVSCLNLALTPDDVTSLQSELATFASNVATWSGGALALDLQVHLLPTVATSMSVDGNGLWLGPWDIQSLLTPSLSRATSFVMTSTGVRDPAGLHLSVPACGLSFGADYGIAGAGYSHVPRTGIDGSFECGQHGVFEIEWMHQVHFALDALSGFHDLYGTTFPACGQGNPDPTLWFPDPDPNITLDPDSPFCGADGSQVSNDSAVQHVLSTHWPSSRLFVANHCRDGVQDYGESGVDVGGNCLP